MNKIRYLAISALCVFLFSCNTATPQEACEAVQTANCKKMWTCANATLKIGNDEASCIEQSKGLCKMVADGKCPNSTKDFPVNEALACANDTEKASCEDFGKGINTKACEAVDCN